MCTPISELPSNISTMVSLVDHEPMKGMNSVAIPCRTSSQSQAAITRRALHHLDTCTPPIPSQVWALLRTNPGIYFTTDVLHSHFIVLKLDGSSEKDMHVS